VANYRLRIGALTGYPLGADAGVYSLTGQAATLSYLSDNNNVGRVLTALNGYTVPFPYNVPADPVTTSQATVTPATIGANIVAGRALTLQAGSYGSITVNVSDLDIICEAGVNFTSLTFNSSAIRCRITGGGNTTIDGVLWIPAAQDIMIDNIFVINDGSFESIASTDSARVCYKNCTVTTGGDNWGMITGPESDLFVLRCNFSLSGANPSRAPTRMAGINRVVYVNNRIQGNQAGPRFNNSSDVDPDGAMRYLCVAQNQFEVTNSGPQIRPTNGGSGAGVVMTPGWFVDNNIYHPGATDSLDIGASNPENIQSYTITGNRAYNAATNGSTITTISTGTGSTVSNNLNQTYTTTPGVPANVGAT